MSNAKKRTLSSSSNSNKNTGNNTRGGKKSRKILKSRHVCRFDGMCKFRTRCRFFHPKQDMGNNMSVMEMWAGNTDANNLVSAGDCDLFQYKLTTSLTLLAFYFAHGIEIPGNFLEEHDYLLDILRELKKHGQLDRFSVIYQNIISFFVSLKRVHARVSLKTALTFKTIKNNPTISLWRGFRSNYNGYLNHLIINKRHHQTPIILATSLSEDVSYRFVDITSDKPIIWKIIVPREKIHLLPGTIFEDKYEINLNNPSSGKEIEVILPLDSKLKLRRTYEGKTNFKNLDIHGREYMLDISDRKRITIYEWEFLGIGDNIYQENFKTQQENLNRYLESVIPGIGKINLKKKRKRKKKKTKKNIVKK